MDSFYRVNAPAVVSEIIDGEAVIMNLETGSYYSIDGCGAAVWHWLQQGNSVIELVQLAQQHYTGDANSIEDAILQFLSELADQGLVKRTDPTEGPTCQAADSVSLESREAFKRPQLHTYNDMKDLLLLDPIHDVDESGWPTVKSDSKAEE